MIEPGITRLCKVSEGLRIEMFLLHEPHDIQGEFLAEYLTLKLVCVNLED